MNTISSSQFYYLESIMFLSQRLVLKINFSRRAKTKNSRNPPKNIKILSKFL